jgi:hypothetical protein
VTSIHNSRHAWRRIILHIVVVLLSVRVSGQTLDRGEVYGAVHDDTGAVIVGAAITFLNTDTGLRRSTFSGQTGQYSAVLLPVGSYIALAQAPGFSEGRTPPFDIGVGQALVINLTLTLAVLQNTVQVTAPANVAPALGLSLDSAVVDTLPLDGRDYRDMALLAPTSHSISGPRGTLRVAGQPGDYLALNVDGADFTNNLFGEFFGSLETKNFTIPLEAIQEFRVSAGGLQADIGRTNGGLINVVTKSGENHLSGSTAYYLRHHALTSTDAFNNAPTGLVRHDLGGSLGGPLVENRTFYFMAADVQKQTTPLTVTFARNVSGVAVPELGIADLGHLQGQYPTHEDTVAALFRLDQALNHGSHLSVRTNFSRNAGDNIAGGSAISTRATSNLETFHDQGISTVVGLTHAAKTSVLMETRLQVSGETRPRLPQASGPEVQIADTGTFGGSSFLPATQDMYRYEASEHVMYTKGRHNVKIGVDYNGFNVRNNSFALALNGAYVFSSLESFQQRQPAVYSQNFGLNGNTASGAALLSSYWQHEFSGYVQDRFVPIPTLTIDVGLRYDAVLNPQPQAPTAGLTVPIGPPNIHGNQVSLTFGPVPQGIPNDTDEWAPRGSVSYDVGHDGTTILKGSAGYYYGRTPILYFPLRGSGISNTTLFLPSPSQFGITFPEVLPSAIAPGSALAAQLGPPAIEYVDPTFSNPTVLQIGGTFSRQLSGHTSVDADVLFSNATHLRIGGFRSTLWDRNLFPPTQFDEFGRGVNVLASGRPDPTITQANALTSFGRGRYEALVLTLRRRQHDRWQLYVSYTLSKSSGDASTERDTEAAFGPSDPFNPEADYGINELDQRHQVTSYLSAALPFGLSLGSSWSIGSGLAFPVYSAIDSNGDGALNNGLNPDRPAVNGRLLPRFPFHQPAYFTWDLRIAKALLSVKSGERQKRADVVIDVFNVLNTDNKYADPHTQAIWGSANFRVNNQTLGPRFAQLGVRFVF